MTRYIIHLKFTTRVCIVHAQTSADAMYAAMGYGLIDRVEEWS